MADGATPADDRKQLGETLKELATTKAELETAKADLKALTEDLASTNEELGGLKSQHMDQHWGSVYQSLSEARNVEFSVFWTRYEVMAALNVAVAGAVIATDRGFCLPSGARMIVGVLGFAVAIAWFLFTLKGSYWVSGWNDAVIQSEERAGWRPQSNVIAPGREGLLG